MEIEAVTASYRRWAPVYDETFGAFTRVGRRRAVEHVNRRGGSVLEVGVGRTRRRAGQHWTPLDSATLAWLSPVPPRRKPTVMCGIRSVVPEGGRLS